MIRSCRPLPFLTRSNSSGEEGAPTKRVVTLTRQAGFEDFARLHPQHDTVPAAKIAGPARPDDPAAVAGAVGIGVELAFWAQSARAVSSPASVEAPTIAALEPGGAAEASRSISVGDALLAVNGWPCTGSTAGEVTRHVIGIFGIP